MAAKRVEWQYHRTRLRTPCNFMASLTMTFARKRIKVYSSSGRTWMSCLSEWKRLGIGLASRLALRLASSCFSSTPIVGLPEIKASESATDTTIQCLSLFQATGIDFFYSIYQYCSSYSHQKRDPWIEISRLQVHKKDFWREGHECMEKCMQGNSFFDWFTCRLHTREGEAFWSANSADPTTHGGYEKIWKLLFPTEKNIIVDCIYRPPNQYTAMFIDNFDNIFALISKDKKHCYVMRDFNLDLLRYNHHVPTQEFIDSLFSHVFLPLISNPTCLTSCSATLVTTYSPTALNIMLSVGLF